MLQMQIGNEAELKERALKKKRALAKRKNVTFHQANDGSWFKPLYALQFCERIQSRTGERQQQVGTWTHLIPREQSHYCVLNKPKSMNLQRHVV